MEYQDCVAAVQADEADASGTGAKDLAMPERPRPPANLPSMSAVRLAEANINPATGLATDYLNHFNEAIMLLEMVATCPDCLDDFHGWRHLSYREHFQISRFASRDLAIAAYESADPAARACLDRLAATMTTVIEQTRASLTPDLAPRTAVVLAERAATWLKVLVARAGSVIHGELDLADSESPQTSIDRVMQR